MRILFTSNDPGSAQQNNALANLLNQENPYDLACITSKVSLAYYSSIFKKELYFDLNEIHCKNKIKDFINNFKPDFIFLGLSEGRNSLDFITSQIAIDFNIRTASIQNYYGWTGSFNKEVKPDYFFVIDEFSDLEKLKYIYNTYSKYYSYLLS